MPLFGRLAETRPDPDALLRAVQNAEARKARGHLKVFMGMSAGVGKTYAMLSEAHEQVARGINVLAGYIETHGRAETDVLLEGLQALPFRHFEHRGVKIKEFDLDAALRKRPSLVLVDELAHTNATGARHPKRWQDIEELLQSGINVYTTVNVQHMESLVDVVAQITGVTVLETVPDSIIERADEVELIDIPPEDLPRRLKESKDYQPDRVDQALNGFFRTGNLIALRELALRRTADRVDAQMQSYREEEGVKGLWAARERIVVCVAPNLLATKVVRAAARIGTALHAETIALYVTSDRQANLGDEDRALADEALRIADNLGIETVTATGHDIVGEIIRIAKRRNATMVVVGKPIKPRWKEVVYGSVVDELVRRSGDINVQVITGEGEAATAPSRLMSKEEVTFRSIAVTLMATALATGVCALMYGRLEPANLVMIYLLAVAYVASRFGPKEAALASLLCVASFDFFFVPPRFTFTVGDTQYFFTFLVMLGVALLISTLALRMRHQASAASDREARTSALYSLSRELAQSRKKEELAIATARRLREVFGVDAAILLPCEHGPLTVVARSRSHFEKAANEMAVAQWTYANGQNAGLGTNTLPGSAAMHIPLRSPRGTVGVLAVKPAESALDSSLLNLLETVATGVALAVERTILAKESQEARIEMEAERVRSSLLSSVSHDLRTPLTSISGTASILQDSKSLSDDRRKELAQTIYEEAERLNRLVQNLLDMSRLESDGGVRLNLEWHSIEELIGSAINRTESLLKGHKVVTNMPSKLPLVKVDGILLEQALVNLLENAARHTPKGSTVEIGANMDEKLQIEVVDDGPGIPVGQEERIFDKFYRPNETDVGTGLGLSICKAIAEAHGGRIEASNSPTGGAMFMIELQAPRSNPQVPHD